MYRKCIRYHMKLLTYLHNYKNTKYEACIGYFGIRDIGLFLRDTGIFVFFILG